MRILIAEDDPMSKMLLKAMLERAGHEVVAAADGTEALRLLEGEDAPRLAVLDWIMPGATGVEICRRMKARQDAESRYLILLTSNDRKEDIVEGLKSGANDYVTKPFDPEELQARIGVGVRVVELQDALNERLAELEESLAKIKRLKGLVPICCHCRKVRDDNDYWKQVEVYIEEFIDVQFSHGLCPECLDKYYPADENSAEGNEGAA